VKIFHRTRSIAFRLIVAVLAVELVSSIAVIFLSLGYERHIHMVAFEVMLRGHADSLLVAVQDSEDPQAHVLLDTSQIKAPPDDVWEVYDQAGRLLGRSPNWQGVTQSQRDNPEDDFFRSSVNGRHFRIVRLHASRMVDAAEPGGGKLRPVTILYGGPTEHVWHAIRSAVEFYAAGDLLLLIVTGPLIAWLLHRGLLPLRQLAGLAAQVSVDAWQFSPPASAYTTPELAPLTHALESVLKRLEQSFLAQRAFVSDAAHELKTAVAVVKSSLQLLNMKPRSAKEYQAGLERCLADSRRLELLVADMLALARVESPGSASNEGPATDLVACSRQAFGQLETAAAVREVQLISSVPEAEVKVGMVPEDCGVLVCNLLLNAIQHSPPGSTVEMNLSFDTDLPKRTAVLAIVDRGEGIPADALPHVFERFYRGDPSRTRNTGGTGLGLAIAKAIAHKAAGSITITSQTNPSQPDSGTTVTVRVPVVA
jgi:signal transduction histidine kinase